MSKVAAASIKKFEERFAKAFGEGTLKRSAESSPYEVISTGSLTLDYRLTVGGYVEGRITEIWGPDGVGKTTLALMGLANAQRKHPDKLTAFIDVEQKFDPAWAVAHGVDLERNWLYRPKSAEDVADALKMIVSEGAVSMVVLDSVGAMIPTAELEKGAGESAMGKFAGIITRMVKMAAPVASQTGTAVILINQVRANLGYGADTTTGGGFALKHVSTMKLKLKRTGTPPFKVKIGNEDRVVGHEIAVTIERNGVAPAYRTAIFPLFHVSTEKYGPIGIDQADEATTLGIDTGVIERSGAWYTLPGGDRHQGREAIVEALRADPVMLESIRKTVLSSVVGDLHSEELKPEDIPDEDAPDSPNFRKGSPDEV